MQLNRLIDQTILKPNATREQVTEFLQEVKKYKFYSVCLNPMWVSLATSELANSETKVCTVIGFPLGATSTQAKIDEARNALKNGASELDMVIAIGALKSSMFDYVEQDIAAITKIAHENNVIVKVIIETCLLTEDEKKTACLIAKKADADFVKTSTGFSTGGATIQDIRLMRETVGETMGVKASGGIHTKEEAIALIEAGASRIGTSAGISLIS